MQKLATMISIDRMRNVAIRSSFSALKRFLLISRQSRTHELRPVHRRDDGRRQPVGALGVVDLHLDRRDLARRPEVVLRPPRASCTRASRRTRTCRCRRCPRSGYLRVFGITPIGPEIAERRDERDLVADVDVQRLRELPADDEPRPQRRRLERPRARRGRGRRRAAAGRGPSCTPRRPSRCRSPRLAGCGAGAPGSRGTRACRSTRTGASMFLRRSITSPIVAGSIPCTTTPARFDALEAMTSPCTTGVAATTPRTARTRSSTGA